MDATSRQLTKRRVQHLIIQVVHIGFYITSFFPSAWVPRVGLRSCGPHNSVDMALRLVIKNYVRMDTKCSHGRNRRHQAWRWGTDTRNECSSPQTTTLIAPVALGGPGSRGVNST